MLFEGEEVLVSFNQKYKSKNQRPFFEPQIWKVSIFWDNEQHTFQVWVSCPHQITYTQGPYYSAKVQLQSFHYRVEGKTCTDLLYLDNVWKGDDIITGLYFSQCIEFLLTVLIFIQVCACTLMIRLKRARYAMPAFNWKRLFILQPSNCIPLNQSVTKCKLNLSSYSTWWLTAKL